MEALAAVGLASNIVQFVDFSFSLVSKTSEIHRSGSAQLQAQEELDLIAKDLSLQCAKIKESQSDLEQSPLADLSLACKQVSDDLVVLIAKMKRRSGSLSKWSSFRHALRSVLSSEEIKALTDRIGALRSQMTMQLLISLEDQQKDISKMMYQLKAEMQLQALKRDKLYPKMSGGDESFEPQWKACGQSIPSSNSLMTMNHTRAGPNFTPDEKRADIDRERRIEQVLEAISQITPPRGLNSDNGNKNEIDERHLEQVRQCATSALDLVHEQKILQSLTFDMMQFREAIITRAHSGTFDWLLQSQEQGFNIEKAPEHVRLPFIEWLEHNDGAFWIAGKPGSGKSTLMKHILNDPKTRQHLETWAGDCPLVIAGYFFWHRGNELQRSQQGLLQSLLYAILQATPGLANQLCPARVLRAQTPWTLSELESIFKLLGHGDLVKQKFCFFIDALDEYHGDHFELVENLQSLVNTANIKLCLASRPWPCFEDAFGKQVERRLYLQDLTKPDIEQYVREKLELAKAQTVCEGESEETEDVVGIIREVVEKSQGVFLWVTLVVRSLREGLANGDSITTLEQTVHDFPADLEPFFETLIQSVEPKYRRIMAKTFLVALETTALPLVTYSFLEEEDAYALSLPNKEFSAGRIRSIQTKMRRRINGRYKGLLECWDKTRPMGDYRLAVEFLHRTVRDFLQTAPIQSMLHTYLNDDFDAYRPLCRTRLAQLKTMPETDENVVNDVVSEILRLSRLQQDQSKYCDYPLLHQLGEIGASKQHIGFKGFTDYASVLARRGLFLFLRIHTTKHPHCLAAETRSLIDELLNRPAMEPTVDFDYGTTGDVGWRTGFDVEVPEEVLQMAKVLLGAGSRPTRRTWVTSAWVYLVSLVSVPSPKAPSHLDGIIEPLLESFIDHGIRFRDLLTADHGKTVATSLIRGAIWHAPALKVLQDLFKNGCDAGATYPELDNQSIWSLMLVVVQESRPERSMYAADAIMSCINHGVHGSVAQLQQLLTFPQLTPAEKDRIREAMKRASESKPERTHIGHAVEQTAKVKHKKIKEGIFARLLRRSE